MRFFAIAAVVIVLAYVLHLLIGFVKEFVQEWKKHPELY